MSAVVQLVGFLMVVAGAVAVTGSAWPVIAGGAVLLVAVEVPGLVRRAAVRRVQRDELARQRAAVERRAA